MTLKIMTIDLNIIEGIPNKHQPTNVNDNVNIIKGKAANKEKVIIDPAAIKIMIDAIFVNVGTMHIIMRGIK